MLSESKSYRKSMGVKYLNHLGALQNFTPSQSLGCLGLFEVYKV